MPNNIEAMSVGTLKEDIVKIQAVLIDLVTRMGNIESSLNGEINENNFNNLADIKSNYNNNDDDDDDISNNDSISNPASIKNNRNCPQSLKPSKRIKKSQ